MESGAEEKKDDATRHDGALPVDSPVFAFSEPEEIEIEIEVDGGIDLATGREVVAAGATVLVAGTSIFHQSDVSGAVVALRKSSS